MRVKSMPANHVRRLLADPVNVGLTVMWLRQGWAEAKFKGMPLYANKLKEEAWAKKIKWIKRIDGGGK